jgi:hypothetical protein
MPSLCIIQYKRRVKQSKLPISQKIYKINAKETQTAYKNRQTRNGLPVIKRNC